MKNVYAFPETPPHAHGPWLQRSEPAMVIILPVVRIDRVTGETHTALKSRRLRKQFNRQKVSHDLCGDE